MQRWIAWGAMIALLGFGCGDDDDDTDTSTTGDMGPADMDTPTPDMQVTPDMTVTPDMPATPGADAYDRYQDALADVATTNCACDLQGIETVELCEAFQTSPAEVRACESAAYLASLTSASPSYICQADAFETYATCFEAAACDSDAQDACGATAQAALEACPALPDDVFGDDFITCLGTNVLGGAGSCPEGDPSSALGEAVFSGTNLVGGWDFQELSCAGDASPDRAFQWTAPSAGAFTFDTVGSQFDTILAVLDGGCEGSEISCNDDSDDATPLRSSTTVLLEADQTVILVVAGYDFSAYGDFQINISMAPVTEPDMAALTRERTALAEVSAATCACDMGSFGSVAECTAFGAQPATYDTCVDTAYSANYAGAGSQVTCGAVVAEAYATCVAAAACDEDMLDDCQFAYILNDDCLPTPTAYDDAVAVCLDTTILGTEASTCPEAAASSATGDSVFSGTTVLGGDDVDLSGSCGGSAGSADRVYQWTAPSAGTFVFDTIGSTFDTVLALLPSCGGTDTACNDDASDNDIGTLSRLTATVTEGEDVFVVVEGFGATSAGAFQVNINAM